MTKFERIQTGIACIIIGYTKVTKSDDISFVALDKLERKKIAELKTELTPTERSKMSKWETEYRRKDAAARM